MAPPSAPTASPSASVNKPSEDQIRLALQARRDELISSIQDIEAQLSIGERYDPETHERLDEVAYLNWRRRAISARKHLSSDLRMINARLKTENDRRKKFDKGQDRIEAKVDLLLNHFGLERDGQQSEEQDEGQDDA